MALSMKALFFTLSSGVTAGNTIDCTGFGFQPKAYIIFSNRRIQDVDTVGAVGLSNDQVGIGFGVDSTHRSYVVAAYISGATICQGAARTGEDAVLMLTEGGGSVSGAIDHDSYLSDGIRFIVDTQLINDERVMIVAFGGDDITNATVIPIPSPTATGDEDYTGAGFDPGDNSICFFLGQGGILASSSSNEDAIGFSFGASWTKDATKQYLTVLNSDDDSGTMDTDSHSRAGQCIGSIDVAGSSALDARASFVQSITDGIRLNWPQVLATARHFSCLIIKGGGWFLGDLLTQTNTTTDIVESGFGFQPKGAMFFSHCLAQSSSATATQAGAEWSVGSCTSTSDEKALALNDENGTGNMETSYAIEFDSVYANISATATIEGLMHAISFPDADGFTMEMSDADPAQNFVWYVAAGDTPVVNFKYPQLEGEMRGVARGVITGMR